MAFNFSKSNLPKQLFINNEYVDAKGGKKLSFDDVSLFSIVV